MMRVTVAPPVSLQVDPVGRPMAHAGVRRRRARGAPRRRAARATRRDRRDRRPRPRPTGAPGSPQSAAAQIGADRALVAVARAPCRRRARALRPASLLAQRARRERPVGADAEHAGLARPRRAAARRRRVSCVPSEPAATSTTSASSSRCSQVRPPQARPVSVAALGVDRGDDVERVEQRRLCSARISM